jgi:hypothetical protein
VSATPFVVLAAALPPLALLPVLYGWAFGWRSFDARFAAGFGLVGLAWWWCGSCCGLLWGFLISHPLPIVPSWTAAELMSASAALGGSLGIVAMSGLSARRRRTRRIFAQVVRSVRDGTIASLWPAIRDDLARAGVVYGASGPELADAALALVHGGHHDLALELVAMLDSRVFPEPDPVLAYAGAVSWAARGEPDKARAALERFVRPDADPIWGEAIDAATAVVEVVEGNAKDALARIPSVRSPRIETIWRLVEASCHAAEGDRERARASLSPLRDVDVRIIARGSFPASAIARELMFAAIPYR